MSRSICTVRMVSLFERWKQIYKNTYKSSIKRAFYLLERDRETDKIENKWAKSGVSVTLDDITVLLFAFCYLYVETPIEKCATVLYSNNNTWLLYKLF